MISYHHLKQSIKVIWNIPCALLFNDHKVFIFRFCSSFRLKVQNLGGVDYSCAIAYLWEDIDPAASKHKVSVWRANGFIRLNNRTSCICLSSDVGTRVLIDSDIFMKKNKLSDLFYLLDHVLRNLVWWNNLHTDFAKKWGIEMFMINSALISRFRLRRTPLLWYLSKLSFM